MLFCIVAILWIHVTNKNMTEIWTFLSSCKTPDGTRSFWNDWISPAKFLRATVKVTSPLEKGKNPFKTETIINQGSIAGQAKIALEETWVALLGQNNGTRGRLKYGYSRGKLAMTPKELVEDSWLPVLAHASRTPSSVTGVGGWGALVHRTGSRGQRRLGVRRGKGSCPGKSCLSTASHRGSGPSLCLRAP